MPSSETEVGFDLMTLRSQHEITPIPLSHPGALVELIFKSNLCILHLVSSITSCCLMYWGEYTFGS